MIIRDNKPQEWLGYSNYMAMGWYQPSEKWVVIHIPKKSSDWSWLRDVNSQGTRDPWPTEPYWSRWLVGRCWGWFAGWSLVVSEMVDSSVGVVAHYVPTYIPGVFRCFHSYYQPLASLTMIISPVLWIIINLSHQVCINTWLLLSSIVLIIQSYFMAWNHACHFNSTVLFHGFKSCLSFW